MALDSLIVEPAVGRLSPASGRAYRRNVPGSWCERGRASVLTFALLLGVAGPARLLSAETFLLPAPVPDVVTNPPRLMAFAAPVSAEVERALAATPSPEGDRLGLLLAMRVHVALLTGDTARALEAAAQIRARQPTAIDRAYAGLTTQASVAARREAKPATPEFVVVFRRELARGFASLPMSSEAIALLEKQRDRIRATTREALLAEADRLGAQLDATRRCTLEDADKIIRIGHRLENIVPLRETMLAVFDEAIAARKNATR